MAEARAVANTSKLSPAVRSCERSPINLSRCWLPPLGRRRLAGALRRCLRRSLTLEQDGALCAVYGDHRAVLDHLRRYLRGDDAGDGVLAGADRRVREHAAGV